MTDRTEFDLEAALDALAGEVVQSSPRPVSDLVARVLADSDEVAATAALGRLADEISECAAQPGDGLVARVLADAADVNLDQALQALAGIDVGAAPAVNEALVARVLADAGEVTAESPPERAQPRPRQRIRRLSAIFFGWRAGAAAAMAAALVIGIGIGGQIDDLGMPMFDQVEEEADFLVSDNDEASEDFL